MPWCRNSARIGQIWHLADYFGVRQGEAVHLVQFNFERADVYQRAKTANGRQSRLAEIANGFTGQSNWISSIALVVDWTLYIAAITTAVVVSAIWAKLLAAVVAGTAISMLFILGHDAAHRISDQQTM